MRPPLTYDSARLKLARTIVALMPVLRVDLEGARLHEEEPHDG
jgi:hypothetical protein